VDPLIAPPGVANVEHTSTGPTFSVTRVGGESEGTDTHPVRRVREKCSTTPGGGDGAARERAGRSRLDSSRNVRTTDTRSTYGRLDRVSGLAFVTLEVPAPE
jgi:hypothetical protein